MKGRMLAAAAAVAMAVITLTGGAQAQNFPAKPVTFIVPWPAGGSSDLVLRALAEATQKHLGQPIVIENRAGAGGTVGSGLVAKADPDGYSILSNSNALTIAPAIFPNLAFDAARDLASVLMIGSTANVMIVPKERPWKTIGDFIAEAKAKPGSISYGSVGIGSAVHISSEKFRLAAGFEATHVPYRGGGEVIADILGGRIDFYFCPLATALPLIQQGQVRALLVSTAKRAAELPDVPSPVDIGLKDADSAIWFGVLVPAKTPRAIIDRLHAAGTKVLADPATQEGLKKLGIEPMPLTPGEMDDLVKREIAANFELIKAAGIKQ
jgi:tripartite-type tricarboxylate transporter receptor subunit TctC